MGIHSLALPEGVDVADALARAADGEETWESQDNPGHDDWEALRHAESAYFAMQRRLKLAESSSLEALTGHTRRREKLRVQRRERGE